MIFLDAVIMKIPRIHHLGETAIIDSNPAIQNTSHYFQQENNDDLGSIQSRTVKKPDFCNQPCKKNQPYNKKKILQAATDFILAK